MVTHLAKLARHAAVANLRQSQDTTTDMNLYTLLIGLHLMQGWITAADSVAQLTTLHAIPQRGKASCTLQASPATCPRKDTRRW
jgi:hypothetical protein